jgi:putative NADH-flavin reductase
MTAKTFLVLGATGGTGKHFVSQALSDGHRVRALVRSPQKLPPQSDAMEVHQGSITGPLNVDALVAGVDAVIAMIGDTKLQAYDKIALPFVQKLVPAMRRAGVKRFLYQAGGLSRPYGGHLTPLLWTIRQMLPRGYKGQHADNEAVMAYLATEARDIDWVVHRAGIGSDGASKGTLERSPTKFSVGTHIDCAAYNYRTILDGGAIHTADFSHYVG